MLTKTEGLALVRDLIDDPQLQRWPDARLEVLVTVTLDDLWADLLSVAPWSRSRLETPTTTAAGLYDLGSLADRLWRIQSVVRDGTSYGPVDPRHLAIEDGELLAGPHYTWAKLGTELWLFPLEEEAFELRYSSRPATFRSLAGGANVEWPDGHESVWVHECAGRALLKGAAEDPAGHLQIAAYGMQRLKAALARDYPGPNTVLSTSNPRDWGAV